MKVQFRWKAIIRAIPKNIIFNLKDFNWNFMEISDTVGTVMMWIAYILVFPFLLLISILMIPISIANLCLTAKKICKTNGTIPKNNFVIVKEQDND